MMNDLNVNQSGFLSKAAALLNNKTFSDVEIQVIHGNNSKSYYAHKLFLSMNSEEFHKIFYASPNPPKVIKIFDFMPKVVFMMLEFIYTDQTDMNNIEDVKNVYSLAKKYEVKDLKRYCLKHLVKETLTVKNIFDKYEFAISENIPEALKACRDCVSINTMDVINSDRFKHATLPVVEDILQLDTLSVMSELQLIDAAIAWGKEECFRRGAYTESIRICVYPLFKHLRFLTLSAPEFCDLVEKYDKLLNSHESSLLTRAIIQPDMSLKLPSGFSSNSNPRRQPGSMNKESEVLIPNTGSANIDKNKLWSFDSDLQDHLHDKFGVDKTTKLDPILKSEKDMSNSIALFRNLESKQNINSAKRNEKDNAAFSQSTQKSTNDNISFNSLNLQNELLQPFNVPSSVKQDLISARLAHNVDKFSQNASIKQNFKPTPVPFNRSESAPLYTKKTPSAFVNKQQPILRVTPSPQSSLSQRIFNFPLFELDKGLGMNSAFATDIKCLAKIHVNRGAIEIYGVELKMKQKDIDESIPVHLTLNGSNISTRSRTYEEKLKNNVLSLMFIEPVKLQRDNYLDVEVVIEDITLNRCSGCRNDKCELNVGGLHTSAEIWMKSNQANNDSQDFFYLFNRLMYKPLN